MPPTSGLIDWLPQHNTDWNLRPLRMAHRLHEHPVFALDALARLIERLPPQAMSLVQTSRAGDGARAWREGERGGCSGQQVVAAIAAGSMWLNLREVNQHDAACAELIQALYGELGAAMPGFRPGALKMGILLSSPRIQVHYHVDLPGQALWQIAGRKRVWVYPPTTPHLSAQALEDIAYSGFEFKLPFDARWDAQAQVFDLAPGQALSWPLNSPHRVENGDMLNISVTTEHWTAENRRSQQLNLANGVLRHRLGIRQPGRRMRGAAFWGKWALQAAWRRSPWAARAQQQERPVCFRLDPERPGAVLELAQQRP